jgi:ATP phosphoribosyltransferase
MKLALPKGRLLPQTSAFLKKAGLELSDYDERSRSYRPKCGNFPHLSLKVFHERDIPIQVAVGNYELGICGLEWVEELLVKYPSSALVKVQGLGYGNRELYISCAKSSEVSSIEELKTMTGTVRIATEYPNLAESFALNQRLRRFKIFPLWGAAEVYPPESADLALICAEPSGSSLDHELRPLASILQSSAFLISYQHSWESKDMSALLHHLYAAGGLDGR